MGKPKPVRLTLVEATWCPHCDPLSTERVPVLAKRLGVAARLLDIDVPAEEAEADRIVRAHGLWDEDYVIPLGRTVGIGSNGSVSNLALTPGGIYRSEVFPGLWLNPAELIGGDMLAIVQAVQQILADPEHAAFVARLQQAAQGTP